MREEELIRLAEEMGFAAAAAVDTGDIVFQPSFRPLCAENVCGKYGVNYACPPDCGTVEEWRSGCGGTAGGWCSRPCGTSRTPWTRPPPSPPSAGTTA